jgi:hypothetical protein
VIEGGQIGGLGNLGREFGGARFDYTTDLEQVPNEGYSGHSGVPPTEDVQVK